jgi:hypothetical protein
MQRRHVESRSHELPLDADQRVQGGWQVTSDLSRRIDRHRHERRRRVELLPVERLC